MTHFTLRLIPAAAAACLGLAWTLGTRLVTPDFHRQHPAAADAAAYRRIGEIARREASWDDGQSGRGRADLPGSERNAWAQLAVEG